MLNFKLFLGLCWCSMLLHTDQSRCTVFNLKPWQADWAHFLFFSKTLSPHSYSCTHLSGSCPVKPQVFFILGRWAAPLKQFGQLITGDQEHQNSHWECFTHSVPPVRWFFSSCVWTETSDLQSTFSLLWSLGSRHFLRHFWQQWYQCERFPRFIHCKLIFHLFPPFCISYSLFLSLSHKHNLLLSSLASCRPE